MLDNARREQKDQLQVVKNLLNNMYPDVRKDSFRSFNMSTAREVAFVITDIQGSTALARMLPGLWPQIQEVHDLVSVMRSSGLYPWGPSSLEWQSC